MATGGEANTAAEKAMVLAVTIHGIDHTGLAGDGQGGLDDCERDTVGLGEGSPSQRDRIEVGGHVAGDHVGADLSSCGRRENVSVKFEATATMTGGYRARCNALCSWQGKICSRHQHVA